MPEELNSDQLVAKMAKDERLSVIDLVKERREQGYEDEAYEDLVLMSPRDYALSRGLQPQQVYYYIKRGKIQALDCLCHRNVIDARQADEVLKDKIGDRSSTTST